MTDEKKIKYDDDNMLVMARDALAAGANRSSFAQCAEWAHDEATAEAERNQSSSPPPGERQ